jgi:hypothetical protein
MIRLTLIEVQPDSDPRQLRWKFRHGTTLIVARSLRRFPIVTDVQTLGLIGAEPQLPAGIDRLIERHVAAALPFVHYADRSAS